MLSILIWSWKISNKTTNELWASDQRGSSQQSSVVFGWLRQSSEIFWNNRELSKTSGQDILNKIILAFLSSICLFLEKITGTVNFSLLVLKCVKFHCFLLHSRKISVKCSDQGNPIQTLYKITKTARGSGKKHKASKNKPSKWLR